MTTEMFIGGLMILTVAAVIVVSMTSSENSLFERMKFEKKSSKSDQSGKGK